MSSRVAFGWFRAVVLRRETVVHLQVRDRQQPLAGVDVESSLHELAFQVRGVDLKRLRQDAVDEQRRTRRIGLVRPVAIEDDPKAVFTIDRKVMGDVRGVDQAQSAVIIAE